jgi:hypothetical protein
MSISKREFNALFKREVKKLGGPELAAEAIGVSAPFIRNILACRDLPSVKVCKFFELEAVREIKYRYEYLTKEGVE